VQRTNKDAHNLPSHNSSSFDLAGMDEFIHSAEQPLDPFFWLCWQAAARRYDDRHDDTGDKTQDERIVRAHKYKVALTFRKRNTATTPIANPTIASRAPWRRMRSRTSLECTPSAMQAPILRFGVCQSALGDLGSH